MIDGRISPNLKVPRSRCDIWVQGYVHSSLCLVAPRDSKNRRGHCLQARTVHLVYGSPRLSGQLMDRIYKHGRRKHGEKYGYVLPRKDQVMGRKVQGQAVCRAASSSGSDPSLVHIKTNFREWLTTPSAGMAIYSLSALWMSLMGIGVKFARMDGASVVTIILGRTVLGIALALSACAVQGINPLGRQRKALALRGLVGCGGIIGVLVAAARLPLAVCSLLGFLAPFTTALCAAALLGEPVPRAVSVGAAASLAGVCVVLQPWHHLGGLDPVGVPAALASPLCIGLAGVMVRKLASGGKAEHPQVVMIYLSFITTIVVSMHACLLGGGLPSLGEMLRVGPSLLLVGVTGWLNQLCITMGLARAPAAKATAMGYLQVVFAAVADYSVFGVMLSPSAAIGGLMILCSVVLVAVRSTEVSSRKSS